MRKKIDDYSSRPPVDDATRVEQLTRLRTLLHRVKGQPGLGPVTAALLKMLDAEQVACEWVRQGRKKVLALTADVTPADIQAFLPLATHPVPYFLLRMFLERMIYVAALEGDEADLTFMNSDDLHSAPASILRSMGFYRSGIPDPSGLNDAARQASAESALADYLGVGFPRNPDGWLDLFIDTASVEVHCVKDQAPDVTCPSPETFTGDLIVFARARDPREGVALLGWIERGLLIARHKPATEESQGGMLTEDELLPMETLKEKAQTGAGRKQ